MNRIKRKIVIIGGSAAGPAAAAKAKRTNPDNEVILIEKSEYISVGTCELPYLLSGIINDYRDIVFFSPEKFKEEKGADVLINTLVTNINRKLKNIETVNLLTNEKKYFSYDKLILCTGSKSRIPEEFKDKYENVFTLKNINDALRIKSFIEKNKVKETVIIGSNYTGLELIDFVRSIGSGLTFLDKEEYPLPGFETEVRKIIKEGLTSQGINFYGNIINLKPIIQNNKITHIKTDKGLFESDLIILATGFVPNTELARIAGIGLFENGSIRTSSKMQTTDDNIFAAGDCTSVTDHQTNKPRWMPLATIAHKQGHIAGANASGTNISADKFVKNTVIKVLDNVIINTGLSSKEIRELNKSYKETIVTGSSRIKVMPGGIKHMIKLIAEKETGKILGANLIGGEDIIGNGNLLSFVIKMNMTINDLLKTDYSYTPLLTPFTDTLLIAANKLRNIK